MAVGMSFLERAALAGLEEEDGFSLLNSPIFCYLLLLLLLLLLILLVMIAFNAHKDSCIVDVCGFI